MIGPKKIEVNIWSDQLTADFEPSILLWSDQMLEFSLGANPMIRKLIEESFTVEGGMLAIPGRPGLGVTIRDDFVSRYRKGG